MLTAYHMKKCWDTFYASSLLRMKKLQPLRIAFAKEKLREIELFAKEVSYI